MDSRLASAIDPSPRFIRTRPGPVGVLLTLLLFMASPALAAEVNWFNPSGGTWSSVWNWFPNRLPAGGDVVWVKAQTSSPITVVYSNPAGHVFSKVHVDSTGWGAATLDQSVNHLQAGEQNVGVFKFGAHNLTGGTSTLTKLHLGYWGSGGGTYNLSGTGALLVGMESIGNAGSGTFNHTAGTNTVTGDLNLGLFGSGVGVYNLSGAAVLSSKRVYVGNAGVGYFNQNGSSYPVAGDLVIGNWGGAWGRYTLTGGGSVSSYHQFIGNAGVGRMVQNNGSNYAGGNLVLGNLGSGNGTFELLDGTFSANIHYIGGFGYGRVEQSGGVSVARGNLVLGNWGGANGTFVLSGGDFSAADEHIGGFGVGVVEHSGGTHTAAGNLQAGTWGSGYGRYELSGTGILDVASMILGGFGRGYVVQTGGEAHVAGSIILCFWPNSGCSYSLGGGLLSAAHIDNRAGGHFYFSAGDFNATTFANKAQLHLSGAGVRVVTPVVTNSGTVFATDTEAQFTGTFTNQGAYDSAAADSEFANLVVTETGYVLADEASRVFVVGDLLSASTKALNWDTTLAELVFVDSDDDTHTFQQTGNDLGDTYDGYSDNFAWAKLGLETGQSLTLSGTGSAVYVGALELADGLPQLASITSNGKNIYYNPLLPENGYLGGTTHSLGGTGEAIPVPEPSMGLLLLAGLPCLAGLAARRRRV